MCSSNDSGTLRKIASFTVGKRTAKVYKDSTWQEFQVKFYIAGILQKGADYHTGSRSDALGTASTWAKEQQQEAAE